MKPILNFLVIIFSFFALSATTKNGCNHKVYTIVLQNKADVADAHLNYFEGRSENNNANTGSANELPVYTWTVNGTPVTGRALLKFSLSSIPAGSKIISAKLSLYGYPVKFKSFAIPQGNAGDDVVILRRVVDDWDENKVTWNNQPKISAEDEIALPVSTSTWNFDIIDADVTQLIEKMRATNNYGFSIRLRTEETYRSIGFLSSEYPDVTKRPKLVITYKN